MRLTLENTIADEVEIAIQKRQQTEYTLLGSYIPRIDGSKIYEYNRATKEIEQAAFIANDEYVIGAPNHQKLDVKKGCVYVEAINKENAIKRLRRGDIIYSA